MRETFKKIIDKSHYLLYVLTIGELLVGTFNIFYSNDTLNNLMFYMNYINLFLIVIFLIKDGLIKNFMMCSFYGCFFLFLMAQKVFLTPHNHFLTFKRTILDVNEYAIFVMILALGIIIPYYSYKYFMQKNADKAVKTSVLPEHFDKVIKIGFLICLPFAIYMQGYQVIARLGMSYTDGYLINVEFPTVVKIFNYLFPFFSLSYLALKPKKVEMYAVLLIHFVVEGGIQLAQGRRALFAVSFLFAIWYLFMYYGVKKTNKKLIISLCAMGFAIVVLFYFVEVFRGGGDAERTSIFEIIRSFMISTGGSDSVIANTIQQADNFYKPGYVYLIDPIINNPITMLVRDGGGVPQGYLYLARYNSFAHWISYMTDSGLYFRGYGMGSSYLAESYLAFGLFGVGIISVVLGKVISVLSLTDFRQNFFRIVFAFFFVTALFTYPRSGAFDWFYKFSYFFVAFCTVLPFYLFFKYKMVKKDGK